MHKPAKYLSDNYVVLDFETTNIDYGNAAVPDNTLLLTCYKTGATAVKAIWGTEYYLAELIKTIEAADVLVAHNAKMELKWLIRAGLDITNVLVYDTMIGEYVLAGNTKLALDLGSVANRYGYGDKEKYVQTMLDNGHCPSTLPRRTLLRRCAKDVLQTEAVFLAQREKLKERDQLRVLYTRCWVTPALADIEMRGMYLNEDRVRELYIKESAELHAVEQELEAFTGGVNPRSPKQVAEYLYDTLGFEPKKVRGEAVRGTDKAAIAELVAKTPEQEKFLELKRKHATLEADVGKALEKFNDCIEDENMPSVLLAQFNQCVTGTHRLSSSGSLHKVQFQNLHRKFKKLFRARTPGWLVAEADGAQLEFRVAGFLGQDGQAYHDIMNNVDVHTFTAQTLTAAGQQTDRQGAKAHTFKPLYGGQSGTTAEKAYYAAFRAKYPGIAAAQEAWKRTVLLHKQLRICTGLIFYWPDTRQDRTGYITNSTAICNYPVQSLATADIIPIAVGALWREMRQRGMQSFLVNTVHDSVVGEIHPDEVELFYELAVKAFTETVYDFLEEVHGIRFNFPLGVGFKCGEHWGEGVERTTQVVPRYEPPKLPQRAVRS